MKNLHLLIILAFLFPIWNVLLAQNTCLPEGIAFLSQAEIDSFPIKYPGCTVIEGGVYINEKEGGDITNLDSLYPITAIKESLSIGHGDWPIYGNDSLRNLHGLQNLSSIGWSFMVFGNASLTDFSGLERLTSIGADFWVHGNKSLTSFRGLESLVSVATRMDVRNNDALVDFSGLESLLAISGDLTVWGNIALTSLRGLDNLTYIGRSISLINNDALTSLHGLEGLTSLPGISGIMFISDNDALTSLRGLDNLIFLARLDLEDNDALTSLRGLERLHYIKSDLIVSRNNALNNLSGLESLSSTGAIRVRGNSKLTACAIQPVCNHLEKGGKVEIHGNAPGCNDQLEVKEACGLLMLDKSIQLLPNITTGLVNIIIPEYTAWNVIVRDAMGRIVIQLQIEENGEADLSAVPKGLYFFTFRSGRYTITKRILKE